MVQMFVYAALLLLLAAAPAEARTLKIVALGDSLTAGYGVGPDEAFPVVLERALRAKGHDVEIVNAGVSGDTASGGAERVDWSVPDETDGVILELGANDMLRGTDPTVTRAALDRILKNLSDRKIPVLIAGMYAQRSLGPDYVQKFESMYPELAAQYGAMLYPFFLEGVAGISRLNQRDGIHPSPEGVRTIVERILPTMERFLSLLDRGA